MMNMNNKGFTIAEILIAASVGLIVLGAIYAAMNMGQRSSVAVERKVVAQQDARAALDIMAAEIRMASCNPAFATNMWVDGPTGACGNTSANQMYKGIQEATANSITVEMDIHGDPVDGSPDGDVNDPNEIIRYEYLGDANNERVTRQTSCGGGAQAFLGDQAGNTREVRVVNQGAGVSLFKYFDRDDNPILPANLSPPGGDGTMIPDIRRIEITLVVDTEEMDPNLGKRRRTFCSTSVIPRNNAINW